MGDEQEEVVSGPDPVFEPIVKLPLVEIKTLEEEEEVLFVMRAKLFRYDTSSEDPEWKERGTGEVKILKHVQDKSVRILMRRDKTLKICANHYIQPYMELKPSNTSDRAWIWNTLADFADEEPKAELLAIKFANKENAHKFKTAFEEAAKFVESKISNEEDDDSQSDSDEENKESSLSRESAENETDTEKALNSSENKENQNSAIDQEISKKLSELAVEDDAKTSSESSEKTDRHNISA